MVLPRKGDAVDDGVTVCAFHGAQPRAIARPRRRRTAMRIPLDPTMRPGPVRPVRAAAVFSARTCGAGNFERTRTLVRDVPYRGSGRVLHEEPTVQAGRWRDVPHAHRFVITSVGFLLAFVAGAELIVDRLPRGRAPQVSPTYVEPPPEDRRLAASTDDVEGFVDDYEPFARDWSYLVPGQRLRILDAAPRDGLISRRTLRRGSAAHADRLDDCYRGALEKEPRAFGVVRVAFRVRPNGTTSAPEVQSEQLSDAAFLRCVERSFSGLLYQATGTTQDVRLALHLAAR